MAVVACIRRNVQRKVKPPEVKVVSSGHGARVERKRARRNPHYDPNLLFSMEADDLPWLQA